ncbi:PTS system fructose-like transporter subunit EIIC [Ligilactobacillus equi DSM 15833 = JCM 10991]|uniref:PTS system fructose-like transporter subunit EIIC n=2 Tax=Ligilactobacillus equi TaxID=137357 RepID=A0A0R1T7W6_9LACO|nr:PTS system fructose-like transporter subunit EIIC [Ligilactobacillus equi DSM 15833 = JCM 10991]
MGAKTKKEAITNITDYLLNHNIISDKANIEKAIFARESELPTYIGDSISLPHARSSAVKQATILVGKLLNPILWDNHNYVNFIFLILVPEKTKSNLHLNIIAYISRLMVHKNFRNIIIHGNEKEVKQLLTSKATTYNINSNKLPNSKNIYKSILKRLMTATGYMLPFIVIGGVLSAIPIMLTGSHRIPNPSDGLIFQLYNVGQIGMMLYIPVFGAYLAYSMAGKPGLAPGFITTYLTASLNCGFLGSILSGLLVGNTILLLKKIYIKHPYASVFTALIYPIIGTIIPCVLIGLFVASPLAIAVASINHHLSSIQGMSRTSLGAIVGAMIGFDFGGPINKIAATFCQSQISTHPFLTGIMGTATAVPPIGIGISSIIFKNKFPSTEKKIGVAAILMGFCGITEGAIPFIACNPILIITTSTLGAAVSGITASLLNVINYAPWGGIIVLPVIENKLEYLISIMFGVLTIIIIIGLTNNDYEKHKNIKNKHSKRHQFKIEIIE